MISFRAGLSAGVGRGDALLLIVDASDLFGLLLDQFRLAERAAHNQQKYRQDNDKSLQRCFP